MYNQKICIKTKTVGCVLNGGSDANVMQVI